MKKIEVRKEPVKKECLKRRVGSRTQEILK